MEEDTILKERTGKVVDFIKKRYSWISYVILAFIVYIGIYIRTLNLSGLRDITTGGWTLGPDLDPFLFLRWAEYIVQHGSLMMTDVMRYFPIGYDVRIELILHPYLIAWFHKVAVMFGSTSVTQSAALFPVFVTALATIFLFLFVRKVFSESLGKLESNVVALLSALFFVILPPLLPRTIAGIPEKEASGFMFLFLAFYLFLTAWKSNTLKWQSIFAVFAGIATAMMALVWGGSIYITLTVGLSLFIAFIFGQIDRGKLIISVVWVIVSLGLMNLFSARFTLGLILSSTTTLIAIAPVLVMVVHFLIFETGLKHSKFAQLFPKIPRPIFSLIVAVIIGIVLGSFIYGPSFAFDKLRDLTKPLISPTTDRLGITVAENRQPYFSEWAGTFGPTISNVPIFFWLFIFGSVYLYWKMLHLFNKKEKIIITVSYAIFLLAMVFSRYSSESSFNGTNAISIIFYIIGALIFVAGFGYYYFKNYNSNNTEKFSKIDFGLIILFTFFFLSIISARGAVRLIMILGIPAAIIVSYFLVSTTKSALFANSGKIFKWAVAIILILASVYSAFFFYQVSAQTAVTYIPSTYTQQWQKSMSWVRENTPENAVFAHWWDYGYWVQSIGKRATVTDGGNSVPYWNHLIGRYALTGTDERKALELLYSHNVTHFLIDSTDIGKYTAFSSIGSDENYDRYSWINAFVLDQSQTQETKNTTLFVYVGGAPLDQDIIYMMNGTRVFLPAFVSGLGGIIVQKDKLGNIVSDPMGVFIYQNRQYQIPLKYVYSNGVMSSFGNGIESGIFMFPRVTQTSTGAAQIDQDGALLYLSERTINSQLARLYLFNQKTPYFTLVNSQDDFIVEQLKSQTNLNSDFIYYDSIRGPIRIWQVSYPSDLSINEEYLLTDFPDKNLSISTL